MMNPSHPDNQPVEPDGASSHPALAAAIELVEGLPLGVIILNPDFTVCATNREGLRLLGCGLSDCLGQSFPLLWSKRTQSELATIHMQLQHVVAEHRPTSVIQHDLLMPKGDTVSIEWACTATACDQTRFLTVSIRDLSREHELEEERNRLVAIAEDSPLPMIELDRQANLLYANPAMVALLRQFGYTLDGFPHVAPSNLPEVIERCFSVGYALHTETVLLHDASFSWTFCPVIAHGIVRGYAMDLTNLYKTQEELRQSTEDLRASNHRLDQALEAAQESARLKGAFFATVSHELRTPMNGVIGMTSLLMETSLTPEQLSYAETIKQCGEALLQLINDVLESSKIEAGKLELESLDFNLRTTVEQVLAQFAERAETKGLELTGLVHAAVPTALTGDPGRLRQVLTNLVANAVKFTDKGEVTLQAYLEEDGTDRAVIRFEVTDSGIGISPETQAKLFQPFVQADSSTTRKYGGTGLGLSICKQLVELMGGHIGVRSTLGQGSTFWCTTALRKQAGSPRVALPTGDLVGKRVLIVDDNESNRLILHHMVSSWGMVDELAEDAATAFVRISEARRQGTPYDLAILDVVMPGKDGLQLARELQQHPAGSDIRLVVMTSMLQRGHAEQARQAGAMGYLPKPVRHDELRDCLRTVLGLALDRLPSETATPAIIPQLITRYTVAENVQHQRLLIVEDNLVNQKLAVRMVEKLGYKPDVVENGQEALTALSKAEYVAILMDCQMPIMDGLETTKHIREREASDSVLSSRLQVSGSGLENSGSQEEPSHSKAETPRHIPIIAVTANAMQGDRERCIAAGMDDYLTKPIKLDELRTTLGRWTSRGRAQPTSDTQGSSYAPSDFTKDTFDSVQMYNNIGRDKELFRQLIGLFLDRQHDMLADLRTALASADATAVERMAHTFKGTAGNLCATKVARIAGRLEAVGRLKALHDAAPVYAQLELEVTQLIHVLDSYRQGFPTGMREAA